MKERLRGRPKGRKDTPSKEFHAGDLILDARTFRGLSQEQLAELCDMEQPRICELEKSESCTTAVLSRIAHALGLQIGLRELPSPKAPPVR